MEVGPDVQKICARLRDVWDCTVQSTLRKVRADDVCARAIPHGGADPEGHNVLPVLFSEDRLGR